MARHWAGRNGNGPQTKRKNDGNEQRRREQKQGRDDAGTPFLEAEQAGPRTGHAAPLILAAAYSGSEGRTAHGLVAVTSAFESCRRGISSRRASPRRGLKPKRSRSSMATTPPGFSGWRRGKPGLGQESIDAADAFQSTRRDKDHIRRRSDDSLGGDGTVTAVTGDSVDSTGQRDHGLGRCPLPGDIDGPTAPGINEEHLRPRFFEANRFCAFFTCWSRLWTSALPAASLFNARATASIFALAPSIEFSTGIVVQETPDCLS